MGAYHRRFGKVRYKPAPTGRRLLTKALFFQSAQTRKLKESEIQAAK